MNLVIGSAFRNSARRGHVVPYFQRVSMLRTMFPNDSIRVAAIEGDSTDGTSDQIQMVADRFGIPVQVVTCNHGGPEFGSVETEARFKALSKVGNAIFDAVNETDDLLLYVESDLQWDRSAVAQLITVAQAAETFGVVAPLVMAGKLFYDIWGFRGLDGRRFSPFHPYYPGLMDSWTVFEVGSVGSCFVARGDVARQARIRRDYCLVDWCEDVRAHGHRIGVVPTLEVRQA